MLHAAVQPFRTTDYSFFGEKERERVCNGREGSDFAPRVISEEFFKGFTETACVCVCDQ